MEDSRRDEFFSDLCQLISEEERHRDLVFVCEDEVVRYHKAVVLPKCSFLENIFRDSVTNEDVCIVLDRVNSVALQILMNCIYIGSCNINTLMDDKLVEEVYSLKDVLGLHVNMEFEKTPEDEESITNRDYQGNKKVNDGAESLFYCDACNTSFDLSIKLKKHIKKLHQEMDPLPTTVDIYTNDSRIDKNYTKEQAYNNDNLLKSKILPENMNSDINSSNIITENITKSEFKGSKVESKPTFRSKIGNQKLFCDV